MWSSSVCHLTMLISLKHVCSVSMLLLVSFIVRLSRNVCYLPWQLLSRWVPCSLLGYHVPLRDSSMNLHLYCHQGGSSGSVHRLKQVWSAEFLVEPLHTFCIFTAAVWRMPQTVYWTRSCFQYSRCFGTEEVSHHLRKLAGRNSCDCITCPEGSMQRFARVWPIQTEKIEEVLTARM